MTISNDAAESMSGIATVNMTTDSFFISQQFAEALAKRLPANYMESDVNIADVEVRSISNAYPILLDEQPTPAAYVINYNNEEGYVIISADARYEPILSFTNNGNLLQYDTIPAMMGEWLGYHLDKIHDVKLGTYHDKESIPHYNYRWQKFFLDGNLNSNINTDGSVFTKPGLYADEGMGGVSCNIPNRDIARVSPLLSTRWGQGEGYNDSLDSKNCINYLNGRPPVGCVATATAQILKYWSKSDPRFNYINMPNIIYSSGTHASEVARLMKFLGNNSSLGMDYDCEGSSPGITGINRVTSTLVNNFGFTANSPEVYNSSKFDKIVNELNNNRPVILDGTRKSWFQIKNWKVFTHNLSGHAWVCDGYKIEIVCNKTTYHLHMNWGWNGKSDGFVFEDHWYAKDVATYQYRRGMIINIKP